MSSAQSTVETAELAPCYRIPRIIRGGWQLAGDHGAVDRSRATNEIGAFVNAGLNVVDGADIYTGVEEIYGAFNARRRTQGLPALRVHTKCVPDLDDLARVDEAYVRAIVMRSLQRLQTERLDLVQLHWWDYAVPGCVAAAQALAQLQREGLIAHLGGTNFDTPSTAALLDAGVPMVSMQVQYSLLDRRPAQRLVALGAQRGVQLLCYGTLAGGFFSERWLGAAEPGLLPGSELSNRSLIKYKLVIDDFGGCRPSSNCCKRCRPSANAMAAALPAWPRAGYSIKPVWPPPSSVRVMPITCRTPWPCLRSSSTRKTMPCWRRCWRPTRGLRETPTAKSATRPGAMAAS